MANLATRGWDPFAGLLADYGFPVSRYADTYNAKFEVKETKDAIVLLADVPGIKSEDIDVSYKGNVLTVTGKREQEKTTEDEAFHMVERSYGSFTRSFTLPEGVDAKRLDAELKDGVLTVTLPKVPEAKPQKVTIKATK